MSFNNLLDVNINIYRGRKLTAIASRLEIGARSPFLLELMSSLHICDGCQSPVVLVFPEEDEDEDTLRKAFTSLVGFKEDGFSDISQDGGKVCSLLYRLKYGKEEVSHQKTEGFNVLIKTENIREMIGESNLESLLDNDHTYHKPYVSFDDDDGGDDDIDEGGDDGVPYNGGWDCDESVKMQEDSQDRPDEEGNLDGSISSSYLNLQISDVRTLTSSCPTQTTDVVIKSKFVCGLCPDKSFDSRHRLYDHYSESHFKTELKQFTAGELCLICGRKVNRTRRHVGQRHRMIEEFLEESLQLPKKPYVRSVSSDRPKNEFKICPNTQKISFKVGTLKSSQNFKEDLKQFIETNQIQCQVCDQEITDIRHLVQHVGLIKEKGKQGLKGRKKICHSDVGSSVTVGDKRMRASGGDKEDIDETENALDKVSSDQDIDDQLFTKKRISQNSSPPVEDDSGSDLEGNSQGNMDETEAPLDRVSSDIDEELIENLLMDSDEYE